MTFVDREISSDDSQPVGLYKLEWGPTVWAYTSAEREIVRQETDGQGVVREVRYQPVSISDSGMTQGGSAANDFTVDIQADVPIVDLFRSTPPSESIWLTVRRKHVGEEEALVSWIGTVANVTRTDEAQGPGKVVAVGIAKWLGETLANTLGLALDFGQVMVLVAIATALATRLPFVVNLVVNLFIYFLGHLAPVIVRANEKNVDQTNPVVALIRFLGNLFDTLLPSLEFFNMGPAIIRDTPLGLTPFSGYVAMVLGYAVIYTAIALLVGLILFEDRDLA